MKIFQIFDGRAHWLTPYKSLDELYVDVPQEGGIVERQRRYPESDLFVEAPDEVQEGWIYLGDGKFRSDEPERLQVELEMIDRQLRVMYKESLFQDWIVSQAVLHGVNVDELDLTGGRNPVAESSVIQLIKTKSELTQKLNVFESEIVSQ